MKTLHPVNLARLSNLEFGQHVKSIHKNISLLGVGFVTDAILSNYLLQINNDSTAYDAAMVQIFKSDETAKIVAADLLRDAALSSMTRYLSVFEFTEITGEHEAYLSLKTVMNTYNGIQSWNFEEESNGIDNLVAELGNVQRLPMVTMLNMNGYVANLDAKNVAFKKLFAGRTQEISHRDVFDVKQLRSTMKISYTTMAEYALAMAKAVNTPQYNDSLDVINVVRKYYADLLAKRKPAKINTPEVPIPPMP